MTHNFEATTKILGDRVMDSELVNPDGVLTYAEALNLGKWLAVALFDHDDVVQPPTESKKKMDTKFKKHDMVYCVVNGMILRGTVDDIETNETTFDAPTYDIKVSITADDYDIDLDAIAESRLSHRMAGAIEILDNL